MGPQLGASTRGWGVGTRFSYTGYVTLADMSKIVQWMSHAPVARGHRSLMNTARCADHRAVAIPLRDALHANARERRRRLECPAGDGRGEGDARRLGLAPVRCRGPVVNSQLPARAPPGLGTRFSFRLKSGTIVQSNVKSGYVTLADKSKDRAVDATRLSLAARSLIEHGPMRRPQS